MTKFFGWIFTLRYFAVLAIIAPVFGALLMFLGTTDTINAYLIFFGREEAEGAVDAGEAAMIKLVGSVDHFLFGTILLIFAVGLYFLFFRGGDPNGSEKYDSDPFLEATKQTRGNGLDADESHHHAYDGQLFGVHIEFRNRHLDLADTSHTHNHHRARPLRYVGCNPEPRMVILAMIPENLSLVQPQSRIRSRQNLRTLTNLSGWKCCTVRVS